MLEKGVTVPILMSLSVAIIGCDDRATKIASEAADRQAQQNTVVTDLNKEVTSGSHQLVEADAKARQAIIGVHHDFEAERARLDQGWNQLENDRRELAGERRTDSILVVISKLGGAGLLVLGSLAFCWFVLIGAQRGNSYVELNEFVLNEFLSDSPTVVGTETLNRLSKGGDRSDTGG
jgi:hypothetical protein